MTEDEVNAEIGKLVRRRQERLQERAALRGKGGAIIQSMKRVVDAAFAGDRLSLHAIPIDEVADDGWSELGGILDDLRECEDDLQNIAANLRDAGIDDSIERR